MGARGCQPRRTARPPHPAPAGDRPGGGRGEQDARRAGTPRLAVPASELARRLLLREGFTTDQRREVVRHGVTLHDYAMHKDLDRRQG